MSEKRYGVNFPADLSGSVAVGMQMTLAQMDEVEASIAKARKQAEADKPKVWDFGLYDGEIPVFCVKTGWWSSEAFLNNGRKHLAVDRRDLSRQVCGLGNLRNIINDGPIVIGLSLERARVTIARLRSTKTGRDAVRSAIEAAVTRYERNMP